MTDAAPAADANRAAAVAAYDVIDLDPAGPVVADLGGLCETAAELVGASSAKVLLDDRQVAAFGPAASGPPQDHAFHESTTLRTPAGQAIGTLCVFDEQPREVAERQRRALAVLARQVVGVLELRLRTRQLERATAELTRSQDRLAAFAGQVSHDLKAPITAIIGFTELLEDMDTITADTSAAAYLGRSSSAARRMLGMIDDLLAFARVGGSLSPVPNPITAVVEQIVADLGATAAGAQVSASGVDVPADAAQFRALMQNLLGNALRYRSERPCVVTVVSERDDGSTVVRITDNGSGIPAESREEVLRPLVRLRKEVPGAGLGLAVCARVVAAHGGTLRFGDAPGGGTVAIVTLPDGPLPG